MEEFIKKTDARNLLRGVKSTQWRHRDCIKGASYRCLNEISKTTNKAFFISTPTHEECKEGFWVAKSLCYFTFETHWSDNNLVRVSVQIPHTLTPQYKESCQVGISRDKALADFTTKCEIRRLTEEFSK